MEEVPNTTCRRSQLFAGFSPGCESLDKDLGARPSDLNEAIRVLAELKANVNEKENARGAQVVLQGQQLGSELQGHRSPEGPSFPFRCASPLQSEAATGAFQSPNF